MPEPVIVPRDAHPISRAMIDPDALKVLYRLHQAGHIAYLVGGSVRDLLLGRRPKDFDVGTSAHPYQIKKLFRNCWIIGRRFRLAHVRFGDKTIEVATFRRHVLPGTENEPAAIEPAATATERAGPDAPTGAARLVHRDNTFGTPEEDARRRDFTINALFYDIATRSIIDYVGGLQDLRDRLVRSIGDPGERFQEDPVRMWRAVAVAERLGFAIDPPIVDAIHRHRGLIALAAPARLIEEYYKILRSGYAERTFQALAALGLLEPVTPELHRAASDEAWRDALDALDGYRQRYETSPPTLTNAILLGTLLVPVGLMPSGRAANDGDGGGIEVGAAGDLRHADSGDRPAGSRPPWRRLAKEPQMKIGLLPIARRDADRLRQILALQRRLCDPHLSPRARRALMSRGAFGEALTWLEIHGRDPELLEHWRGFVEAVEGGVARRQDDAPAAAPQGPGRRRRRRRRRRRPRRPPQET